MIRNRISEDRSHDSQQTGVTLSDDVIKVSSSSLSKRYRCRISNGTVSHEAGCTNDDKTDGLYASYRQGHCTDPKIGVNTKLLRNVISARGCKDSFSFFTHLSHSRL